MQLQNDTIFCFTGPSSDTSWILPGAVDLYLVISVLSLLKTFYYEKTEIQRNKKLFLLRKFCFSNKLSFLRHKILLFPPTFFVSDAPLSLSLQGNDPLPHAAHILEFTAWLISQGHEQPKYWVWSSVARQLSQKHFRGKRREGRNPLASLRTKLIYY